MNSKCLIVLLFIVIIFSGCNIGGMDVKVPTDTKSTEPSVTFTSESIAGITPNITEQPTDNITPVNETTPTATVIALTPTPTPKNDVDLKKQAEQMKKFLPSLGTKLRFFGIAETGHYGELTESYTTAEESLYVFDGVYDDGMGVPDKFSIQYFFDYYRGTVTERAMHNERLNKSEFHSKLHNIVVLKFPLSLGATWSHETTINGKKYWVYAEVTEYDSNKVKVLYTATGVDGYYNNTYFEERTYEAGYGMTAFGNIMPGDLDLSGVDTSDADAVREYILNMYMFGYSLYKE